MKWNHGGEIKSIIYFLVFFATVAAVTPAVCEFDSALDRFAKKFDPLKPSVMIRYNVVYRFLGIKLIKVATATAVATEGQWEVPGKGKTPAFCVEAYLDTLEKKGEESRKRVAIHDRMLVALSNPALDTYVFVRRANQYFNPLLGSARVVNHMKIYDMQSGKLEYGFEDYLTGVTNATLQGPFDLAKQGKEVAQLMKLMSAIYSGASGLVSFDTSPTIYADMDGTVREFKAKTSFERSPTILGGKRPRSLKVDLRTAKDSVGRPGRLVMWVISLSDAAAILNDERLKCSAETSPEWCMMPLAFDYDLALGSLFGEISEISVVERRENRSEDLPVSLPTE